jgi:hydroxypyruvate reductase
MLRALGDATAAGEGATDDVLSRPVLLIAAGKAADAMVRGFRAAGGSIARGLMATTHVYERDQDAGKDAGEMRLFLAGHPVPTPESEAAGLLALELVRSADTADRPIVVLLSGGASALLVAPAEGLTLAEKMLTTRVLLGAGAAIHELNTVRKHLSSIKGGQLAVAAAEASPAGGDAGRVRPVHTFALSDVISPVEDDPGVIGSGPTSPDATSFGDALATLTRLGVRDSVPIGALRVLEKGAAGRRPETPKPGDPRLAPARFTLIGSRRDAMAAARVEAERRGIQTVVIDESVAGEARDAAPHLLATALARVSEQTRPCCVISSGETTVRVTGTGTGGRNQEFALALVEPLSALRSADVAAASVGTDGIDGPTDAAGAIVDSTTLARAAEKGLVSPRVFLANNDAYHFFEPLGDLLRIGHTDTNVCDLQLFLFG